MNSVRRKPEVIVVPAQWAEVIGRNVRRSMRNNTDIVNRWKHRQEHRQMQNDRHRIEQEVAENGVVRNRRKM